MTHELATITFHGTALLAVRGETPAETLVAMKPVVEGMGLDWSTQRRKIVEHPVLGTCMVNLTMQMPGDDQGRVWTFVPLNRLNFWLATIQPNKVPDPETRARVIRYQIECADVLFAHFFGKAVAKVGQAEEFRRLIAEVTADLKRAVAEQVSSLVHAELVQTVHQLMPEIISATLVGDPRVAAIAGVSVRELLDQAGALPRKRDGLNRRIGNRLRAEALSSGVVLHRCARTGTWLFPISFAEDWMHHHGAALVRDHNDRVTGQGVLRFPDRRRPPDANAPGSEASP